MKLLILGGTAWLGGEIARTAVAAGHEVTCVVRGTGIPAGAHLVIADRDHDDALHEIARAPWDAVIDVARQPGHVRRAVRDLAAGADRYFFVSTGNVYASQAQVGADEDAGRLAPLASDSYDDPEDYGAAKVAGEDAVLEAFGPERSLIARSGLIGGPGDSSGRTTYWPWRFAHPSNPGGWVLAPDAPDLPAAVIDVRDLATWLVSAAESGTTGIFNAMGSAMPLPEHLEVARQVSGSPGRIVAAPQQWLVDSGVNEWAGPRSLPLWLVDTGWYGFNARSNARALAAGLVLRPLAETLADSLEWRRGQASGTTFAAGLSDDDERELLEKVQAD